MTASDVAAAGVTTIPESVLVRLEFWVSVTVMDCVPAVLSVT